MKISVKGNSNRAIDYVITYLYPSNDGNLASSSFDTLESFQEFMDECHPDINTDEFVGKYGKKLALINKKAGCGDASKLSYILYCFVGGGIIMSSFAYCGIIEKWYDFHKGYDKANEGYLHTFIAHNWTFEQLSTGIMKVYYWYDKSDTNKSRYKIHMFKDKIVIENPFGTIHSIIVTDKYYVYFDGKKKDE